MPLAGGTFTGNVAADAIANVSTLNGVDVGMLLRSPTVPTPDTLAVYDGMQIQSSTLVKDTVLFCDPQAVRAIANFNGGKQIKGTGDIDEIVVVVGAKVANHVVVCDGLTNVRDSGFDQDDVLLEATAAATYVKLGVGTFTGAVSATRFLSTAPIVYGVYAATNAGVPISPLESDVKLSGLGAATAYLNPFPSYFTKNADGHITYSGPAMRACVQFTGVMNFATASETTWLLTLAKTGPSAQSVTNTWTVSTTVSQDRLPFSLTLVTSLADTNTILLRAQKSDAESTYDFYNTTLTVTPA
jgi:hypothetical protein